MSKPPSKYLLSLTLFSLSTTEQIATSTGSSSVQQKSLFKLGLIFVKVFYWKTTQEGGSWCVGRFVCVLNQVLVAHIS